MNLLRRTALVFFAGLALTETNALHAATIIWTNEVGGFGSTTTNASADISGGTFVDGLYFTAGGTQIVGADKFYQATFPTSTTAQSPSNDPTPDISLTYPKDAALSNNTGVSPPGYGTILNNGYYSADSGTNPVGVAIQFSNLTVGQEYQAQFWVSQNDGAEYVMSLTAGNTIDLKAEISPVTNPRSPGQFAVGLFHADATTETVTLNWASGGGVYPFINAIALRVLPEPGSVVLMILGGIGLCLAGLRRGRRK